MKKLLSSVLLLALSGWGLMLAKARPGVLRGLYRGGFLKALNYMDESLLFTVLLWALLLIFGALSFWRFGCCMDELHVYNLARRRMEPPAQSPGAFGLLKLFTFTLAAAALGSLIWLLTEYILFG